MMAGVSECHTHTHAITSALPHLHLSTQRPPVLVVLLVAPVSHTHPITSAPPHLHLSTQRQLMMTHPMPSHDGWGE